MFLAYNAYKRESAGKPVKSFDIWMETVADIVNGDTKTIDTAERGGIGLEPNGCIRGDLHSATDLNRLGRKVERAVQRANLRPGGDARHDLREHNGRAKENRLADSVCDFNRRDTARGQRKARHHVPIEFLVNNPHRVGGIDIGRRAANHRLKIGQRQRGIG